MGVLMKRVGETEVPTIAPDGGEEEIIESNSASLVRQFNGSYRKLRAMRPAYGKLAPDGYRVSRTSLKNKPGGQGVLTVTYSKPAQPGGDGMDTGLLKDVIWISWERVSRPLRQHPKFATTGDGTTWAQVDAWEKEEDATLRAAYKYRVPTRDAETGKWLHDEDGYPLYTTMDVSASMHLYCSKRLKGIETYDDYRPVVRRVRVYSFEPTTGGCGQITTLPIPISGLSDYTFLKAGDETTDQGQKGKWTRTEVWEGSVSIDEDLYGPGSRTPASGPRPVPPASSLASSTRKPLIGGFRGTSH
jgi:hypothetical protein